MNKTHLIILVVGFGGCIALMMMMSYLLKTVEPGAARSKDPAVLAFAARFQPLLRKPAVVELEEVEEGGRTVLDVTVRLYPKATTDIDRMVMKVSDFVWRTSFEAGPALSLVVRWRDPQTGEPSMVRMRRPGRRRRRLPVQKQPSKATPSSEGAKKKGAAPPKQPEKVEGDAKPGR